MRCDGVFFITDLDFCDGEQVVVEPDSFLFMVIIQLSLES